MKNIFIILICFLFLIHCHRDNFHEEVVRTFKNGKPQIINTYVLINGVRTLAVRTLLHENGRKRSESHFSEGKKHGRWRVWNFNGQLKEETLYSYEQMLRRTTYVETISAEYFYRNGQLTLFREFKNGIVAVETFYQDNQIVKKIFYYPDGIKSDERNYQNGYLHGVCTYWDRNGKKKNETVMSNGTLIPKQ